MDETLLPSPSDVLDANSALSGDWSDEVCSPLPNSGLVRIAREDEFKASPTEDNRLTPSTSLRLLPTLGESG